MAKQPAKEQIVIGDGIQLSNIHERSKIFLRKIAWNAIPTQEIIEERFEVEEDWSSDMRGVELVEHMFSWWETVRNLLGEK